MTWGEKAMEAETTITVTGLWTAAIANVTVTVVTVTVVTVTVVTVTVVAVTINGKLFFPIAKASK